LPLELGIPVLAVSTIVDVIVDCSAGTELTGSVTILKSVEIGATLAVSLF
jgi:hypothetical protein